MSTWGSDVYRHGQVNEKQRWGWSGGVLVFKGLCFHCCVITAFFPSSVLWTGDTAGATGFPDCNGTLQTRFLVSAGSRRPRNCTMRLSRWCRCHPPSPLWPNIRYWVLTQFPSLCKHKAVRLSRTWNDWELGRRVALWPIIASIALEWNVCYISYGKWVCRRRRNRNVVSPLPYTSLKDIWSIELEFFTRSQVR